MEDKHKTIRLCRALIKNRSAKKLLAQMDNHKSKNLQLFADIVDSHNPQGIPFNPSWKVEDSEEATKGLPKQLSLLKKEIDTFLLEDKKNVNYHLFRNIELFSHYRSLGLHQDNQKLLKKTEELAKNSSNWYLKTLFEELKQEANILNHHENRFTSQVSDTFHLYWISEAIFDICVKYCQKEPKTSLLSIDFLLSLVESADFLKENKVIQLYLSLYHFLQKESLIAEEIEDFDKRIIASLAYLPNERRRDVTSLIANRCVALYSPNKSTFYGQLAWRYTLNSFENGWGYIGDKIQFNAYRNLISWCIVANEDATQLTHLLHSLQQKYAKEVYFPPKDTPELQLFEAKLDWKLRQNLLQIWDFNRGNLTKEPQKGEMLLYQFKAGYTLIKTNDLEDVTFWEKVFNIFKKKGKTETDADKPFVFEYEIWQNLHKVYTNKRKPENALLELQQKQAQLSNTAIFYHDRNWYLEIIAEALRAFL